MNAGLWLRVSAKRTNVNVSFYIMQCILKYSGIYFQDNCGQLHNQILISVNYWQYEFLTSLENISKTFVWGA